MIEPQYPGDPEYPKYLDTMPLKWKLITWIQDMGDLKRARNEVRQLFKDLDYAAALSEVRARNYRQSNLEALLEEQEDAMASTDEL